MKIDIQVKATKKEKMQHLKFINREEIKFWDDFPRNQKFYHQSLAALKQLLEPALSMNENHT